MKRKISGDLYEINNWAKVEDKILEMPDYPDYTGLPSVRVLYDCVWQGLGFMNQTHYNLYHNTTVDGKKDGMTHAQERINMLEAYGSATDKMIAEPGLVYNEDIRFFGVKPRKRFCSIPQKSKLRMVKN